MFSGINRAREAHDEGDKVRKELEGYANRVTREAAEARLAAQYEAGMLAMKDGDTAAAKLRLEQILESVQELDVEGKDSLPELSQSRKHSAAISSMPQKLRVLALRNLGEILEQDQGTAPMALEKYIQAAAIDRQDVVLLGRVGRLAAHLGRLNVARRACEEGLDLRPKHTVLLELLIEVLYGMGDHQECLSMVKNLLRRKPLHSRARTLKTWLEKASRLPSHEILSLSLDVPAMSCSSACGREVEIPNVITHIGEEGGQDIKWIDIIKHANLVMDTDEMKKISHHPIDSITRQVKVCVKEPQQRQPTQGRDVGCPKDEEENHGIGKKSVVEGSTDNLEKEVALGRAEGEADGIASEDKDGGGEEEEEEEEAVAAEGEEVPRVDENMTATEAAGSPKKEAKAAKTSQRKSSRQSSRISALPKHLQEEEPAYESVTAASDCYHDKDALIQDLYDCVLRKQFGNPACGDVCMREEDGKAETLHEVKRGEYGPSTEAAVEINLFLSKYSGKLISPEEFGNIVLNEIATSLPATFPWNGETRNLILKLERRLRHWNAHKVKDRPSSVNAAIFSAELYITEMMQRIDTNGEGTQSDRALLEAGYLYNIGQLCSHASRGKTLSLELELRFYRCSGLWALYQNRLNDSEYLLKMCGNIFKSDAFSSSGGKHAYDPAGNSIPLAHCNTMITEMSLGRDVKIVKLKKLFEKTQRVGAKLDDEREIKRLAEALFSSSQSESSLRFGSKDSIALAMGVVHSSIEEMTATKVLDTETRETFQSIIQRLNAQMLMLALRELKELNHEGGNATAEKEKRGKDAKKRAKAIAATLLKALDSFNSSIEGFSSPHQSYFAVSQDFISDHDTLARLLVKVSIDIWSSVGGERMENRSDHSGKFMNAGEHNCRQLLIRMAEALLNLHALSVRNCSRTLKLESLEKCFQCLHRMVGCKGMCVCDGGSFLRTGLSLLKDSKNTPPEANGETAPPAHQAIYCLLKIALCSKHLLVDHVSTWKGRGNDDDATTISFPTPVAAVNAWNVLEPHVKHVMEMCDDSERDEKFDAIVALSDALEAISENVGRVIAETNSSVNRFLDSEWPVALSSAQVAETGGPSHDKDGSMSILTHAQMSQLNCGRDGQYCSLNTWFYRSLWESRVVLDTKLEDRDPMDLLRDGVEDIVERVASVMKADIAFNPGRFESWYELGFLYDDASDLMMNDGVKLIRASQWHKTYADGKTIGERVDIYKARGERCFLIGRTLAAQEVDKEKVEEMLGLLSFERLQGIHPYHNQRGPRKIPVYFEDEVKKAISGFKAASEVNPNQWQYVYYRGKLAWKCYKRQLREKGQEKENHQAQVLSHGQGKKNTTRDDDGDVLKPSPASILRLLRSAHGLAPNKLEPYYRLHATRLKLALLPVPPLDALEEDSPTNHTSTSADQCLAELEELRPGWLTEHAGISDSGTASRRRRRRLQIINDCIAALKNCLLFPHYHRARYRLAETYYQLGHVGKAQSLLSFIFCNRGPGTFDVNIFEIGDKVTKRTGEKNKSSGRRRNKAGEEMMMIEAASHLQLGFEKIGSIGMEEPSRKYVYALRRSCLFFLKLCFSLGDLDVLNAAEVWLRSGRCAFKPCLEDIGPLAASMYAYGLVFASEKLLSFPSFYRQYINPTSGIQWSKNDFLKRVWDVYERHELTLKSNSPTDTTTTTTGTFSSSSSSSFSTSHEDGGGHSLERTMRAALDLGEVGSFSNKLLSDKTFDISEECWEWNEGGAGGGGGDSTKSPYISRSNLRPSIAGLCEHYATTVTDFRLLFHHLEKILSQCSTSSKFQRRKRGAFDNLVPTLVQCCIDLLTRALEGIGKRTYPFDGVPPEEVKEVTEILRISFFLRTTFHNSHWNEHVDYDKVDSLMEQGYNMIQERTKGKRGGGGEGGRGIDFVDGVAEGDESDERSRISRAPPRLMPFQSVQRQFLQNGGEEGMVSQTIKEDYKKWEVIHRFCNALPESDESLQQKKTKRKPEEKQNHHSDSVMKDVFGYIYQTGSEKKKGKEEEKEVEEEMEGRGGGGKGRKRRIAVIEEEEEEEEDEEEKRKKRKEEEEERRAYDDFLI